MPNRKQRQTWKSAAAMRLLELSGNPPTIEEAVRIVTSRLLDGVLTAPTDLDTIAEKIGITEQVLEEETPSEDLLHDDGLRFFESPQIISTEQRHDFALQLAQSLFSSIEPKRHYRGIEYEKLCDMIAMELLLPAEDLHYATYRSLSIEKIIELARQYEVSYRMVAKRLMGHPYIAVFEADNNFITWAYGGVRSGLIDNLPPNFRSIVRHGLETEFQGPVRFFSPKKPWFGSRCVEWTRVPREKTMFLVRLPRRDEANDPNLDSSPDLLVNYYS